MSDFEEADPGEEGSLRAAGWRQGCRLNSELPIEVVVTDASGRPIADRDVHGHWVLATQDCDLSRTAADANEATIELRPAEFSSQDSARGVRSRKFVVTQGVVVDGQSPRITVAPTVLSTAAANGGHDHAACPDVDERRAFKTWLGLRYDRPAVPALFLACQYALTKNLAKPKIAEVNLVRDVLASYALGDDNIVRYELVAVLPSEREREVSADERGAIERWLGDAVLAVPPEAGVARRVEVLPATRISLDFLERAYALTDAKDVTWPRRGGGPIGETSA